MSQPVYRSRHESSLGAAGRCFFFNCYCRTVREAADCDCFCHRDPVARWEAEHAMSHTGREVTR